MSTPDIKSFQRTGDPQADLARWQAMGGTKEQLQAAFGDPERPQSAFTAGQPMPPMPPNGNIWGGQSCMQPFVPFAQAYPTYQNVLHGGQFYQPMPTNIPFAQNYLTYSANSSSGSSNIHSTSSASTKSENFNKGYGKTEMQKAHMQEDNYLTYIEKAQSTSLTKDEVKDLKEQSKAYVKDLKQWEKDYKKEFKKENKKEMKAALKEAKKSGKSKQELNAIKDEYRKKEEDYVIAKFEEKYPDIDYYALMFNLSEICRASRESGLFHRETPRLIHLNK